MVQCHAYVNYSVLGEGSGKGRYTSASVQLQRIPNVYCDIVLLHKVAVSQEFLAFFSLESNPPGPPDKQAKMALLKVSFSWRYSRNK